MKYLACLIVLAAFPAVARSQEKITYADHIRPIFREHCFNCHNQNKATNDLALDSYERIVKGGAAGAAVTPGDVGGSYLWQLVSHESEPHMPPNQDKIAAAKLDLIKRWIAGGALKDSGSKAAEAKPKTAMTFAVSSGAGKPNGPPIVPENLARQPVRYTPRAAAVTAVAAAPWAPVAAIAGQRQIALYNTDTADLYGILPFPEGIPYVLKFSRSGALLLAGGGENVRRGLVAAYDVKTGKRAFTVGDELDVVLAADISPDHRRVALGGPEKIVKAFDADGALQYEIRKHTDWIYAVEFSPDGVLLATGDRAGGLMVWEADTGREYQNLEGHKAAVTCVSFRGDGNVLASGSEDGTIKFWNMEDGRQLKSFTAHGEGVTWLQFAHDGKLVSCGRDRRVKTWTIDGNAVKTFEPMSEPVLRVAFTHDGARAIAGDWSGDVRMWSAADGKVVASLPANPPTLAMQVEAAAKQAGDAEAAAQKANAELAEASARLDQAKKLLAAAGGDKAKADHQKAEIAKLEKLHGEKAAAVKAASESAAALKDRAAKLAVEKQAAEKK